MCIRDRDETGAFERGEATVKNTWSDAVCSGSVMLAAPESYITLGGGKTLWKMISEN